MTRGSFIPEKTDDRTTAERQKAGLLECFEVDLVHVLGHCQAIQTLAKEDKSEDLQEAASLAKEIQALVRNSKYSTQELLNNI